MGDYKVSGNDLTSVADAIRTKGGTSAGLSFPNGFVSAIEDIPTGGGSTLITKSITANGTYNASSDDADGYSSVTVAVPSLLVRGTFTATDSEKGAAKNITLPYSGSGYPIACIIYPTVGSYKSGSDPYTNVQYYGLLQFAATKANTGATPDYSNDNEANYATILASYKYSSSDPTVYTSTLDKNARFYYNSDARAVATWSVRFKSANIISLFIASTSYGFMAGIEYTYEIVYSS